MRIGVLIPTRGVVMQSARRPPVDTCWVMARHADEAGYDAVWVGDSVVAKPRLEPLTTLAYLAGITERVRLGTAMLLPALRHPVVLAHEIANVDQVSRGRVVLGLGVGWSLPSAEREWAACGADHKRRVRRLEEHVAVWRMLWRGEPVTHRGSDFALSGHTIGPLPWHPAGPPVLITAGNRGELLPAQFDRFARLGDGIITTYLFADECRLVRERAEEALSRSGRALPGFPLCVYVTVRMEDDVHTAERVTTAVLVILGVSLVSFLLTFLTGDPAEIMLPPGATADQITTFRAAWGFDDPLPVQYWRFLSRAFTETSESRCGTASRRCR